MQLPIPLPQDQLEAFCQKWKIIEFSLFGSVLRDDFSADSDVDVLVTFAPGFKWKPWDLDIAAQELKTLIGHDVDLVERASVEQSRNYIRRKHILSTAQAIYVAR